MEAYGKDHTSSIAQNKSEIPITIRDDESVSAVDYSFQSNPASALYGFFLDERDSLRDDYSEIERLSQEMSRQKVWPAIHEC